MVSISIIQHQISCVITSLFLRYPVKSHCKYVKSVYYIGIFDRKTRIKMSRNVNLINAGKNGGNSLFTMLYRNFSAIMDLSFVNDL